MAERIEGKHQHDEKNKDPCVGQDIFTQASFPSTFYLTLQPRRGFIHLRADVNDQKGGQRSDDKHSTPSNERKQGSVYDGCDQISDDISLLQQSGEESASLRGQCFKRQCRT